MMAADGHAKDHKALLILYMESRWDGVCDEDYVNDVASVWQIIQAVQVRGYLALMNAHEILSDEVDVVRNDIAALMEKRMKDQTAAMNIQTCPDFKRDKNENHLPVEVNR